MPKTPAVSFRADMHTLAAWFAPGLLSKSHSLWSDYRSVFSTHWPLDIVGCNTAAVPRQWLQRKADMASQSQRVKNSSARAALRRGTASAQAAANALPDMELWAKGDRYW